LQYLYLLFDEENPLHSDDSNYVFTTEGHILTLGQEHMKPTSQSRKRMRTIENHQCPAYLPYTRLFDHRQRRSGLVHGVRSRPDVDYARHLVGLSPTSADEQFFSPEGWCERPKVEPYVRFYFLFHSRSVLTWHKTFDFVLAPNGRSVPEDLSPSLLKLAVVPDGYVIHNVTGVRTQIVQRLDGKGYDIRKRE